MDRVPPYLIVFVGAGLGGVARLVLNNAAPKWFGYDFPWATVIINVTGSVLMGLLVGWLAFKAEGEWGPHLRLFLAQGSDRSRHGHRCKLFNDRRIARLAH